MSVLQRKELEDSPLADLHAIASELAIERYRALRKEQLIGAILEAQGGEASATDSDGDGAEAEPSDEPEPSDAREAVEEKPRPRRRRSRRVSARSEKPATAPDDPGDEKPAAVEADEALPGPEAEPAVEVDADAEVVAGVLDILPGGSGFVRTAEDGADDVYISPAQIRRCELRSGDEVSGVVRPARRSERHPSLVRVESVNGRDPEPPEERPRFEDLTAVHPTERLPAPAALESVPFGKGSRVAVAGGPGAGATRLLREIVTALAGQDLTLTVVLAGVRPEEVTDWRREAGVPVVGGAFDRSPEEQAQAAELAIERGKRVAERGGHAVVVVDSLEPLPPAAARRVFGAARRTEEGGSLTVIAATGMAWEPQRQASTRIGLDPPAAGGEPQVSASRSGTMRADLLA